MSSYDPAELFEVCDSIVEDGEISGDDLYHLATWINDNPDACDIWPGSLLAPELQLIWSDGKMTKGELRKFLSMLRRIRKEWSKMLARESQIQNLEFIADAAATFDLSRPVLPSLPAAMKVKSSSEKGTSYDVDLAGPSCSCPDWLGQRKGLRVGHLTRCCKHVLEAFRRVEPECGWPGWLGAFFDLAPPPNPRQDWTIVEAGSDIRTSKTGHITITVTKTNGLRFKTLGKNVSVQPHNAPVRNGCVPPIPH